MVSTIVDEQLLAPSYWLLAKANSAIGLPGARSNRFTTTNSTARRRALWKINLPALFAGGGLEVWIRIDGKGMGCHGQHFRIPARVTESSIDLFLDDLAQRLR